MLDLLTHNYILQFCQLGICNGIQRNNTEVESARKGEEVCIKIDPLPGEAPKMFGRHFDEKDFVVSKVTSIDFLIALLDNRKVT